MPRESNYKMGAREKKLSKRAQKVHEINKIDKFHVGGYMKMRGTNSL